jgi:hypothetical protein
MRVAHRRNARTIFDEHALDAFARNIWQSVVEDDRDLWTFVSGYPERTPTVATSAQTIMVRRNSPTDSEVRIRFIVMFLSVMWFGSS